ncbi:MAG: glycosyltransferase family 4 protein [Candidatus Melainabacteria bacterium]|nr:glycosyltransferase family 4 protein [Candidatus Melainabacteria bacterium]
MRVCLISREYPPDTGFGGIATFTRHLAHGLKAIGHDVQVVALAKEGNQPAHQDDGGISVHRVTPLPIGSDLGWTSLCMPYSRYVMRTNSALFAKFAELNSIEPFDAVDTPELLAEGFYPAITKCTPLTVRLYTPHSKFIAERLHNVTDTFDHQFVAMVERMAMLSADVITSPSLDLAQWVANDLGIAVDEIDIVYNPIDPADFSPDGERADFKRTAPSILFVGRLEARKGIHYLIDSVPKVVAAVSDAHFVIVGDDTQNAPGQKSVLTEIRERLDSTGCSRSVTFINRIPLSDLPKYYRAADVCIVPSLYDNSPYTCLEAMSCGRPVIGTDGGGTKEYIVHGQSGLIVPVKNADAIAESLIHLLKNKEERERLGLNARKRVLEVFDRVEIAKRTTELYEKAAERMKEHEKTGLYGGDARKVIYDADEILYKFDRMIGDLVLKHSSRAYMESIFKLVLKRPRLIAAKLVLSLLETVGLGRGKTALKLKEQIRDNERIKLMLAQSEVARSSLARKESSLSSL